MHYTFVNNPLYNSTNYIYSIYCAKEYLDDDVILMHGVTPLFISCKNGSIAEEELYKLHTVATRFGGSHVKKMLVATELPKKGDNPNYAFIQRAKDMGIYLVTDAANLSIQGWRDALKQATLK